jgi:chromosome segregation ATPase
MLRDELSATVGVLVDRLQRVMDDLNTMADPDAAAAQIETVTSEAAEQVAGAEAARSRAESAARQARRELDEANAAAQDLEGQLSQAREVVGAAAERRAVDQAELDARAGRIEELTGELEGTRSELTTVRAAGEDAVAQVAALTAAADAAREDAVAARARADEVVARSAAAVADLEQRLGAAVVRGEELGSQLAALRIESESARARLEAQLAAAVQRAEELSVRADRADGARELAERAHVSADLAVARLESHLEQARNRVSELVDERRQLSEALTTAADRAARAEARAGAEPAATGQRKPRTPTRSAAAGPAGEGTAAEGAGEE